MGSSLLRAGDRVTTEFGGGRILKVSQDKPRAYLVEHDNTHEYLHDAAGVGQPNKCWWFRTVSVTSEELEKLEPMPMSAPKVLGGAEPDSMTATLETRATTYGKFENLAKVSQSLKTAMFDTLEVRSFLAPDQREALEMIASKIARIINGDPNCVDSWHDIGGYAQLIADRLRGVTR